MALISSNQYLTRSQMRDNAAYVHSFFTKLGWTSNAICGMLGNMERESTINPGLWESLDYENYSVGFGLVQWTPATNLTDWASKKGLARGSIETQCKKIQDEYETGGAVLRNFGVSSNLLSIFQVNGVSRVSSQSFLQELRTRRSRGHE